MALCVHGAAWAEAAPEPQAGAEEQDTIIVTGTRRTDRTVAESAVPVDVFDAKTLESQSSGDMNNILRNLVPSFNVGRFAIADGSTFVRPPTLRGLPPDEILVLVNGKRRHRAALVQLGGGSLASGSQGVDLAQIPSMAIERIEVLRDGAAAQYGSDAIAGVINYGLKTADHGISMRARYGQYYKGDGQNFQLSGNAGFKLTDNGFFNVTGEYLRSKQTSRGGQRAGAYVTEMNMPELADQIRNPVQKYGDPDVEAYRLFFNSGIDLNDTDQIYMFGNYGHSHQEGDFNWRQPYTLTGPGKDGTGTATYSRSSVFNPIYLDQLADGTYDVNGATWDATQWFPAGFTPRFKADIDDYSLTAGYKGQIVDDLTFDLSGSFGANRIKYFMSNTFNPSMGPDSPTSFYLGSLEQQEFNLNADFAYQVDLGMASPLTIAFGGERRAETYKIGLGDTASYTIGDYAYQELSDGTAVSQAVGANGFPGYGPDSTVDNTRTSYAAYIDLEADPIEGFTLGVAGRYEHFSDFGNTTNGKVQARYAFTPAIAVRGALSTGFRAPTPGQLYTTNVATGFSGSQPIETATYPYTNPAAQYYGATALKPEKSTNISAGFVVTPGSGFTATIDYYNIKVKDRIGMSGNFDVQASERDDLRALGIANWASLGRVRYFTNAFDTRTQGVDFVLSHQMSSAWGSFSSQLALNYNKTKVIKRDAAIIDDVRKGDIENLNPNWRGNFTETYSSGPLTIIGRANYFGKFTDYAYTADGGNLSVGAEWTFDLEASYKVNDMFTVAVGGENIFDNYPDKNIRSLGLSNSNWYAFTQATVSGSRYVDDSPFGFNGGFWYVRVGVNF